MKIYVAPKIEIQQVVQFETWISGSCSGGDHQQEGGGWGWWGW